MERNQEFPGFLITLEGLDKSGKTTVLDELEQHYSDAVFTREPNDNDWTGVKVRDVLEGRSDASSFATFSMFLADHLNHIENVVGPELSNGNLVVCDRYIDSRYVYQQVSLEDEVENTDSLSWVKSLHEGEFTSTIKPDLTILLDISVEESLRRKGDDPAERFEKKEFLKQVRNNYLRLTEEEPERFVVIDAEQSKEDVKQDVIDVVSENISLS